MTISGKQKASVQKVTLAVSATLTVNAESVHVLPLPLQGHRRTTMGRILRKAGRPEGAVHLENASRSGARDYLQGTCPNPLCDSKHLPCAKTTKHTQAACSANGVLFFTEKQIASRTREQRRVEEKAQWL